MNRFEENSRRMRDYNRELALRRYMRIPNEPEGDRADPEPPLLIDEHGVETRYRLPAEDPVAQRNAALRIGPGPDRWGYHRVGVEVEDFPVGSFWHDPETQAVWCMVETVASADAFATPAVSGNGFVKVWLRVT